MQIGGSPLRKDAAISRMSESSMLSSNVVFEKVVCLLDLPTNKLVWKCDVCECVLLSKAGYVNHLKAHENN